ncbi:hypothetical protein PCASD_08857 [Puccinia coronata f. sp. avenae]|uniref:Uncharacterized protein n=1 Tax=Puccinia coronata f. sp. avenae TaxID=200324 RepID=A0A2N5URZ5_9BASI|nr:hypothetical protein PCASD_08857 [Puccinia coronata f. sp. avenae]
MVDLIKQTMEYLNDAAFEDENDSQDSWLSPSPGAKKYVPFLTSQTQTRSQAQTQGSQAQTNGSPVVTGSQVVTRSAAALSVTAAPGHTPFCGFPALAAVASGPTPGHTPFCGFPASAAIAATPPPGHTPFCGFPASAAMVATATPEGPAPLSSTLDSTVSTAEATSQPAHVYTQPGVMRSIHLDYVLYSQSVIANLIKARPSASTSKKDKKEWEKYSPCGSLRVWLVDLSTYKLETFQANVVENLGKDWAHFRKLLDSLVSCGDIKWQAIIANSRQYGPKKFAFLTSNQDFYEFVKAIYEALNSKVTIKLVMDDPQGKAKQMEHERSLEENLTLTFGPNELRIPLEREMTRLLGNHIGAKWGRNDEKYWIGNLNDRSKSMHIDNALLTIWGRALMHNQNPAVTKDHPPKTKHFVWVKNHTPTLEELIANANGSKDPVATQETQDNNQEKSPTPLPDEPPKEYPRDPSPLPDDPLEGIRNDAAPSPPASSSDVEVVRRKATKGNTSHTSYDSPIALDSSQARSLDGSPS